MSLKTTITVYQPPGQDVFQNADRIRQTIFDEAKPMAKRMSEAYANHLRTTLVRVRALATGKTLQSIKEEMLTETSPARGLIWRRVVARKAIVYINQGRKPGKAPIRFVGMRPGLNGKKPIKWFEPLPALIEWFNALGIRRELWMIIARSIGRKGIKPREVVIRTANAARRTWQNAIELFGVNVTAKIFKK